jgi:hypothetical protein
MQVVAVGGVHYGRGVIGGGHGLGDDIGEEVEVAGGGGQVSQRFVLRCAAVFRRSVVPGPHGRGTGGTSDKTRSGLKRVVSRGGELVEADRDGLAEIHGRLAGVGGDLDQEVAEGEVVTGEAVLFGTEDKGDAASASEFGMDRWGQGWKKNDGLFGFAMSEGSGAEDQGAIGQRLFEGCDPECALEQGLGPNGGLGLAPVRFEGSDDGEAREAEVGHGSCCRSYIEGIAGRDENDGERVALGL